MPQARRGELEKNEVDLAILAELRVMCADGSAGCLPIGYQFCGKQMCQSAFLFIHDVGGKKMKNLHTPGQEHYIKSSKAYLKITRLMQMPNQVEKRINQDRS